jgi:geranylgeranyl reductase family protein
MEHVEDIAIVGGGPAGSYCALELGKQGLSPIIFDHSHPREKPCGGGITPQVVNKFQFVEQFRSKGFTFTSFRIISCTDIQVTSKGLENGFSISRRHFDQGILDMALQAGARLNKEKVIDFKKKGDLWILKTNERTIPVKVLVGADGVNSIIRRKIIGPITKENLALAYGYLSEKLEKENGIIKFLAEIPGYIWMFPGNGYTNIGIGSDLKYGNKLKRLLDDFISSHYPQIKITSRYSAMLPSAGNPQFFKLPCAGKNWILIGDAAGHVDPISGGGILYALWGGKIAAQAIGNGDPKAFDVAWRNEYGQNLEERCKNKEAFFDPLKSTISMLIGLANKTYFWPTT